MLLLVPTHLHLARAVYPVAQSLHHLADLPLCLLAPWALFLQVRLRLPSAGQVAPETDHHPRSALPLATVVHRVAQLPSQSVASLPLLLALAYLPLVTPAAQVVAHQLPPTHPHPARAQVSLHLEVLHSLPVVQ